MYVPKCPRFVFAAGFSPLRNLTGVKVVSGARSILSSYHNTIRFYTTSFVKNLQGAATTCHYPLLVKRIMFAFRSSTCIAPKTSLGPKVFPDVLNEDVRNADRFELVARQSSRLSTASTKLFPRPPHQWIGKIMKYIRYYIVFLCVAIARAFSSSMPPPTTRKPTPLRVSGRLTISIMSISFWRPAATC